MLRCPLIGTLAATLLITPIIGCGGGMSQNDMKKYAIRRKKPADPTRVNPTAAQYGNERQESAATEADKQASPQNGGDTGPPPAAHAAGQGQSADRSEGAAATNPITTLPVGRLSDTQQPPASPLSESERRAISAQNLERISKGLMKFVERTTSNSSTKFRPSFSRPNGSIASPTTLCR